MIEVYLEVAAKKTFAMAIAWPGWGRAAKTPDAALEALEEYRERYAPIAARARLEPPPAPFDVVAEITGNATTDFGAPGVVPDLDRRPIGTDETDRQLSLLDAAWASFDEVAEAAPESLRKGPRGGGRDTSKVVDHVTEAHAAYLRQVGVKTQKRPPGELRIEGRKRIVELVNGDEPSKWPPAYFIRRAAWHVTDHLWEVEDRS